MWLPLLCQTILLAFFAASVKNCLGVLWKTLCQEVTMAVSPQDVIVVWVTVGKSDEAVKIARTIVEEKLAACVNIVPAIRSVYFWKGEVCDDQESLLMIKTKAELFDRLRARIVELHSYEVPEIIAVRLSDGHQPYLSWVEETTISAT
jgi:periplasmic divalent cation tolerance protein